MLRFLLKLLILPFYIPFMMIGWIFGIKVRKEGQRDWKETRYI